MGICDHRHPVTAAPNISDGLPYGGLWPQARALEGKPRVHHALPQMPPSRLRPPCLLFSGPTAPAPRLLPSPLFRRTFPSHRPCRRCPHPARGCGRRQSQRDTGTARAPRREGPAIWQQAGLPREHQRGSPTQRTWTQGGLKPGEHRAFLGRRGLCGWEAWWQLIGGGRAVPTKSGQPSEPEPGRAP